MKVINVYDKSNISQLMVDERSALKIMDDFFAKYPRKYQRNYSRNLRHIEIYQLDESYYDDRAKYFSSIDKMYFVDPRDIIHEFMHMAHYDRKKDIMALEQGEILWEDSLIEGSAEFLACKATGFENDAFIFETFVVNMLSTINCFFEPFFIPNYKQFIGMFPNRKDILSLMYALNFYHQNYDTCYDDPNYLAVCSKLKEAIIQIIDSLIDIETSLNTISGILYQEKFMDLITSEFVDLNLSEHFPEYKNYAHEQIKRKILM